MAIEEKERRIRLVVRYEGNKGRGCKKAIWPVCGKSEQVADLKKYFKLCWKQYSFPFFIILPRYFILTIFGMIKEE